MLKELKNLLTHYVRGMMFWKASNLPDLGIELKQTHFRPGAWCNGEDTGYSDVYKDMVKGGDTVMVLGTDNDALVARNNLGQWVLMFGDRPHVLLGNYCQRHETDILILYRPGRDGYTRTMKQIEKFTEFAVTEEEWALLGKWGLEAHHIVRRYFDIVYEEGMNIGNEVPVEDAVCTESMQDDNTLPVRMEL